MNKIITIGREFGSGGRELGKRLSDLLGIAYYDQEIVAEIAKRTQLAENYVQQIVEQKSGVFFPITIGRTFHSPGGDYLLKQYTSIYAEQANVLREMAERSDCVIVGCCGDYILREYQPTRLFVYANEAAKLARCRQKADEHEHLTDRELCRMIKKVDQNRAKYYTYYTGHTWGDRTNYDLCINTSSVSVKDIAEALVPLFQKK